MNENGMPREELLSLLNNIKVTDTRYERVLSSMCTYPHEIALKAHTQFIESNMGDPGLFSGTCDLERKVISMLGELLHCSTASGYITTGGTESNIQAVRSMRNARRDVKHPNVIVPASAHFSFDKVADISGIEIRKAQLDPTLKIHLPSVEELIDDDTIGLVGIAGTTEFGQIDPIRQLSDLAIKRELFLHVDAAFGGFVIPFLLGSDPSYPSHGFDFDFELKGVTSVTIDPHKMGLSTIPSGGLLFRERKYLDNLRVHTPYLTISSQYSLTGTRSGAAVASTYAVMKYLGRSGYKEIVQGCMNITADFVAGARREGFEPVIKPVMNIVSLVVPEPHRVREVLREEFGWHVSIARNPEALRLVIMPHVTRESMELFLQDLVVVVEDLGNYEDVGNVKDVGNMEENI
ncbi:MAG: tyrosine decarboxylase MfnA [Euryarchaeota archaeon]|nr:tyrosine decarboxylase MfnA [Euryarchaeota archaeon]